MEHLIATIVYVLCWIYLIGTLLPAVIAVIGFIGTVFAISDDKKGAAAFNVIFIPVLVLYAAFTYGITLIMDACKPYL